eukprot:863342-Rhodomonas_salina.1
MTGAAGVKQMDSSREVEEAQQEVVHSTNYAPPQPSAEQMLGAKTVRRDVQHDKLVTEMFQKMELSVHDGTTSAELLDQVEQSRNMDEAGATSMKPATRSDTEAEPVKWDAEKQLGVSGSRRISWVSPGSESFPHPASGLADSDEILTDATGSNRLSRKQNRQKHKQAAAMSK